MTVKVILKQPILNGIKEFTVNALGIQTDRNPEWVEISRGETNASTLDEIWAFKEETWVSYKWSDIERLEVTP